MALNKVHRRAKIKRRIRKKIFGTNALPRLSVFRSNKQIYAQL
ncbi:MAG: 50S ribosomal protein L18, partial [Bacteroidetes bacterium]|nr:50S ribosomal protein L18 [Bacteroidota bacterium]